MDLSRIRRQISRNIKMSPPQGKSPPSSNNATNNQGLATLIVMIVVLTIIIMFCCFAAPGVRDLCKRYVFRTCVMDDPDQDNASTAGESTTPTIILLPYGRMLVVDRTVFAQLQADHTGIDFMELSANLIRAQRLQTTGSTPSILDSETTSKGLSPTSLGFSPPAYDDIFGDGSIGNKHASDLPPSYSEVSLMFRTFRNRLNEPESIELQCTRMVMMTPAVSFDNSQLPAAGRAAVTQSCGNLVDGGGGGDVSESEVNNENNLNKELDERNICNMNNCNSNSVVCIEIEDEGCGGCETLQELMTETDNNDDAVPAERERDEYCSSSCENVKESSI